MIRARSDKVGSPLVPSLAGHGTLSAGALMDEWMRAR